MEIGVFVLFREFISVRCAALEDVSSTWTFYFASMGNF